MRIFAEVFCVVLTLNNFFAIGETGKIFKYVYNNNGFGAYSFDFKTSDGTFRREEGGSRPGSSELVVRGEYGYINPDGQYYSVKYIADANGYQPQPDNDEVRFNDRRIV